MQIHIPVPLQKVMRELPPLPQFSEFPPTPPPPSPEPVNLKQGAIAIFIVMVVVGFIGRFINPVFTILILLLGLGGIIWQMQVQYMTYQSRLLEHASLTDSYFLVLESYFRKQSEYEQKIAITRTDDRLKAYRTPKILEILSHTNNEIAQKALAEEKAAIIADQSEFGLILNKNLGIGLQKGITIQIPGFNYIFHPDYTYIDSTSNLHLAIAISESGDRNTNEFQNICNSFLLKSGWIIINFTPMEVLENPQLCAETITNLVNELKLAP